ncbi:MAG: phosphate ABC transporter, permease protein PstA [Synechococcus sp. TMED187]|nr:MAG: phosphate ABC transporter, permease protein PstA [Synechococcus sp. TMED187]
MTSTVAQASRPIPDLRYKPTRSRNIIGIALTSVAGLFSLVAVLPLFLVLSYVLYKGASKLSLDLFLLEQPAPGLEVGGISNAIQGSIIVTLIASLLAIPIGIGGGIFLAEYSRNGWFANFIRFGTNVLSGVPSIIAGVFIYSAIVSTRILFGHAYSAVAGGMALAVLMLPTVIKTTDEGLKLVPDDLRRAALGVGASRFVTTIRITLPKASRSIATGIVLSIARAAGETAPLIFTALYSPWWAEGIFNPVGSLSVLIFKFATMPYEVQNELAWAASFVLVAFILALNLVARWINTFTSR